MMKLHTPWFKIVVACAVMSVHVISQAAFQNAQTGVGNRAPDIQAAFVNTALKDMFSAIVPSSWAVQYSDATLAEKKVSVNETGPWDFIAKQAAGSVGLVTQVDTQTRTLNVGTPAKQNPVQGASAVQRYQVLVSDQNFRRVIAKWAQQAGWPFSAEHWALGVDIPVIAADAVDADFKTAVRRLLSSTELTEYAVQPCFYSNFVVRVVPIAEKCDRTK